MGSGVAKQVKDKYPEVYGKYKEVYKVKGLYLGDIIPVSIYHTSDFKNLWLINAITQESFGVNINKIYVDYNAVRYSFRRTAEFSNMMNALKPHHEPKITTIAMPKIGCGLGNGDWNIVEDIINEELSEFEVLIYEL